MNDQKTNGKDSAMLNFKKAQSHLARVVKMAEQGEYCINVMQQNLAVLGILKSAHQMLMQNHLNTCFKTAMASGSEKKKQEMIQEILNVIKLYNR